MGFIKSVIKLFLSSSHTRIAAILAILILTAIVPITVFVSQQQQNTKQRASGLCDPACNSGEICQSINEGDSISYICIPDLSKLNLTTPTDVPTPTNESITTNSTFTPTLIPNTCSPACVSPAICNSINEGGSVSYICVYNPSVPVSTSTPTPTPTPTPVIIVIVSTLTPTPIKFSVNIPPIATITPKPTSIPVNPIVQNTPTPFPYCYLKSKGDADCDNMITILDLNRWRTEMTDGSFAQKSSDFNTDGVLDVVDFNIWLTSYADSSLPH